MTDIPPVWYTEPQEQIFNDDHRFKTVAKGRRFGFTHGVANYAMEQMAKSEKGIKVLWGDTVASNIRRYIDRYWVPCLKQLDDDFWRRDKTNNIVYVGNSLCDFRSADRPENWEGFGYDLIILNEAGIIFRNPYLWTNAVRPMLLDNPTSRAIIGGVPKGKNIFFDLASQGFGKKKRQHWKHFTFTSYDNPMLEASEIDDLVDEIRNIEGEDAVKQEIFAEFLDVVEMQYFESAIIQRAFDREYPLNAEYGSPKIAGVDFARKRNRSVIVHRQGIRIPHIHVFQPDGKQWSVRFARKIVNLTIEDWRADHIFIDEGEAGGGVIDILENWGYGDLFTPIMFGAGADNDRRFANKRFEMYALFHEWVAERGQLPKHDRYAMALRRNLESLAYDHTDRGKLKLLPKAGITESPDISDAGALTFAGKVAPRDNFQDFTDPYEKSNTGYVR